MKTLKKLIFVVCALMIVTSFAHAGEIRGRVLDTQSKEPIPFVTIVATLNDKVIAGTVSDVDGYYSIKPIAAGVYNLKTSMISYVPLEMKAITISDAKMTIVNLSIMQSTTSLPPAIIEVYRIPLIDPAQISTMRTIETADIENSPYNSPQEIATLVPGVSDNDESGDLNVRGSRAASTQFIVDGIRVTGPFSLPKSAIRDITVLTGEYPQCMEMPRVE